MGIHKSSPHRLDKGTVQKQVLLLSGIMSFNRANLLGTFPYYNRQRSSLSLPCGQKYGRFDTTMQLNDHVLSSRCC